MKVKDSALNNEDKKEYTLDDYEPCTYTNREGKTVEVTIPTGKQLSLLTNEIAGYDKGKGHYMFTDLPQGEYAVMFKSKKFGEYLWKATDCNMGGDDTRDSDGEPYYMELTGSQLEKTIIPNIHMPTILEMEQQMKEDAKQDGRNPGVEASYHYHSPYHDSGFYPGRPIDFQKTNENGTVNLNGAEFKMATSDSYEVKFTYNKENGKYEVMRSVEKELLKLKTCYIQYLGPALKVGILLYILEDRPEAVEDEEIIAYYSSLEDGGIITYRVVKNNVAAGSFRTKGDDKEYIKICS